MLHNKNQYVKITSKHRVFLPQKIDHFSVFCDFEEKFSCLIQVMRVPDILTDQKIRAFIPNQQLYKQEIFYTHRTPAV